MTRYQPTSPAKPSKAGLLPIITAALCILGMLVCLITPTYVQAAEKTYRICFVEIVENKAFDAMETGFKQRLEQLGFTHVEYEVKNAQGDTSILNQITSQLKNDNFDLVVPIGTPAAQACANARLSAPSVFISVTDPVGAGLVSSLDKPDKNITGTSNRTPVKAIYDLGCQLIGGLPEGKLGILYCSGEKNSQSTVDEMVSYLKSRNRDYVIKTISNSSEAKQATVALSHQAQAIFVPMDSVVQSAMNDVCETAAQAKVAVLGSDPVMVRSGALLSVACSNQKIGAYSADMAAKILEGSSPASLPVHLVDDNDALVSLPVVKRLGLDVSGVKDITLVDAQLNPVKSSDVFASGKPSSQVGSAGSGSSGFGGMFLDVLESSLLMGLEYGLLAIGVYITFRILDLADLTVDGSFGLGMCVSALLTVSGHPILGLVLGFLAGAVAGSVTGTLIVKAKINPLLAGIITMTGLYSVNTFILGGPNLSLLNATTIVSGLQAVTSLPEPAVKPLIVGVIDSLAIFALIAYFKTESGLSMRATGNNELMCRSSSINTDQVKVLGLSLANALVGLCGALLAQYQGFADISSGVGMVMVGLASVIIGEVLTKKRSIARGLIFALVGSVVYRLAIQTALEVNLIDAQALKLVTAVIVAAFMALPALKEAWERSRRKRLSVSGHQDVADMGKADGGAAVGVQRPAKGQLVLKGLQVGFNLGTPMENQVLRGLDLQLAPGDFACIIGSNGAGKSTLFNAIAGSVELQAGSVVLSGNDITQLPDYRRAHRMSRVFQDPMQGTAPDLTVAENIALAYGRSKKTSLHDALPSETYDFIADQLKALGFGLEQRMDTPVGLLSGGQRQAVTLLMATIGNPDLLLLDEHTAALDPKATERVMELTRTIAQSKHLTTLMITHDLEQALTVGNKTILMNQGKVAYVLEGDERSSMNVSQLITLFKRVCGQQVGDVSVLQA